MRPNLPSTIVSLSTLLLYAVVDSGIAVAQRDSQPAYPATIISSGSPKPETRPTESTNVSAPNWTSQSPAVSEGAGADNLRPQQPTFGYPSLPSVDNPVVPANTQVSTAGLPTESVEHIPLAPPSARFTGEEKRQSASTLQMLVSVVSSLLLVVGLFLGVAWCYRKTLSSAANGGLPKQVVNILGRTSISARQQMVLVRFGSKLLLVSVIQGEARTLGEITDPLEVDQLVGMCESSQPDSISNSFKNVLLQGGSR